MRLGLFPRLQSTCICLHHMLRVSVIWSGRSGPKQCVFCFLGNIPKVESSTYTEWGFYTAITGWVHWGNGWKVLLQLNDHKIGMHALYVCPHSLWAASIKEQIRSSQVPFYAYGHEPVSPHLKRLLDDSSNNRQNWISYHLLLSIVHSSFQISV